MQAENIYNRLGEDLNKWQALLVQIRKARGTFDNAETKKEFGPVVIDYGKVSLLAGGVVPVALKRHLGLAEMKWECRVPLRRTLCLVLAHCRCSPR